MSKQLVLENRQAPGDSLMMTIAVRELHRQFPGRYATDVTTNCGGVWQNNPLITPTDRAKSFIPLRLGYSSAINQSNARRGHFAGGFVRDLNEKLNLNLVLSDMRADVYLTDAEKAKRTVNEPYWVIVAGGKADFTAKIWDPAYWQAVVDGLKGAVQFVQAGRDGHIHKPLNGVVNMLGKTSLREFLRLIYHSEGVLCPVTCAMHAAAAFNRPCVVVAGGREPRWWEAYTRETWEANVGTPPPPNFVPHRYLHTIGKLDCCMRGGCGRLGVGEHSNRARDCRHIVAGPTRPQPTCLASIKPEQVIQAVRDAKASVPVPAEALPSRLLPTMLSVAVTGARAAQALAPPIVHRPRCATHRLGRGNFNRRRFVHPASHPARPVPAAARTAPAAARTAPAAAPSPSPRPIVHMPYHPGRAAEPLSALKTPVTICALLYGDYPMLAQRCVESIYRTVATPLFELRLGLNAVGTATRRYVERYVVPQGNVRLFESSENLYKYPMMRKMFWDTPLATPFVIWFDDDSHAVGPDWLKQLNRYVQQHPDCGVIGKPYFYHLTSGQVDWIKEASWYRGKALPLRKGAPITNFVTGGWWTAKLDVIKALNWPDPRLQNNGGDTNFGAACHQNDVVMGTFHEGIKLSDAPRRGVSQKHPGR